MNNLSLFLLGLVLTYIPACLSDKTNKQCFSQKLSPSYPCCKGNKIVYTDKSGDWGVENGEWCGIGKTDDSCFSLSQGYPCCKSCQVFYTDKSGQWGVENDKWCGIKDNCSSTIEDKEPKIEKMEDFEFSFLKMENEKTNMLYSPLSIEYALRMLQEGAANNTFAEINKVVGSSELTKYNSIDDSLSIANGLFVRNTYYKYVKTLYIDTLKEKYNAEIVKDEFKDAKNANKWIEDKTLGIIKNMLKDEMVQNENLEMLIINALAIDMEWVSQFKYDNTYGYKFYLDNGKDMIATMMSKSEVFSKDIAYYKDDNITVLVMNLKDYDGTQLEFMAIMPKENLSDYVNNVSKEQINHIDKNLKLSSDEEYGVNVKIPKFKFDYDLKLKNDLIKLGIKDAFDVNSADFSNMSNKRLFVSAALHKADIELTEKGVKAAAVTVFAMTDGSAMPRITYPVDIIINKPFMFVIRDKKTKNIWFTGTVYEPNSWENDKDDYDFW
ncbi:Non-catalytic module family DOC2 [Piromyces sp. E2]|nr:Non-catalytic module family DOC2 [Piromyces sp. E2]|eukprot:OUM57228.1 Non-catalytic module family DOC2 [Piromyces sp. E2]